jgi:hypothetical protein
VPDIAISSAADGLSSQLTTSTVNAHTDCTQGKLLDGSLQAAETSRVKRLH